METDVSAKAAVAAGISLAEGISEIDQLRNKVSSVLAESSLNSASKLSVGSSELNVGGHSGIAASAHSHSINNPQWGGKGDGSGGIITTTNIPYVTSNPNQGYTISTTGGANVAALPSLTAVTVDGTMHTPTEMLEKAKARLVKAASNLKTRLVELEQQYNDLDLDYTKMQDDIQNINDAISKLAVTDNDSEPDFDDDDMPF